MNRRSVILLTAVALLVLCQQAAGQLILSFSETDSGGVQVTGTGSGSVTSNRNTEYWEILDFDNDFLNDSLATFSTINADSVSGSLTSSGGSSSSINGFGVNRSIDSTDDFSWTTTSKVKFMASENYNFSIVAIFNMTTLSYTDLLEGVYFDGGGSSLDEIFGSTTITVAAVPEPATMQLIAFGMIFVCTLIVRRRQQKSNKLADKYLASSCA